MLDLFLPGFAWKNIIRGARGESQMPSESDVMRRFRMYVMNNPLPLIEAATDPAILHRLFFLSPLGSKGAELAEAKLEKLLPPLIEAATTPAEVRGLLDLAPYGSKSGRFAEAKLEKLLLPLIEAAVTSTEVRELYDLTFGGSESRQLALAKLDKVLSEAGF